MGETHEDDPEVFASTNVSANGFRDILLLLLLNFDV
jgi:hypothetical protein